jgi:hypothetical protein
MTPLLADASELGDKNKAFFEGLRNAVTNTYDPTDAAIFWGAALLLVIIIIMVARACTRREMKAVEPRKDYLPVFVDLLGLTEDDRRLLVRIAAAAKLAEPAAMLLSPQNFERATAALDLAARECHADAIDSLARRLFSEASTTT